jgi:hypothetical protein
VYKVGNDIILQESQDFIRIELIEPKFSYFCPQLTLKLLICLILHHV